MESDRQLDSNGIYFVGDKGVILAGGWSGTPRLVPEAKMKDFDEIDVLLRLLQSPYDEHPAYEDRAGFPPDWASHIEISCSS